MPVRGSNEFINFRATLTNPLRLLQKRLTDILGLPCHIPITYNLFPNTLYELWAQPEEFLEILKSELRHSPHQITITAKPSFGEELQLAW